MTHTNTNGRGGRHKKAPDLYHFTCDHGYAGIAQSGVLLPNIHPYMTVLGPVIWLTDLAEPPTRESVGLTSRTLSCDRMAYRFKVKTSAAVHWSEVRGRVRPEVVEALESYGQPEHWWIARRPLTASEFAFDEGWTREDPTC